jgi:hypothetical protein
MEMVFDVGQLQPLAVQFDLGVLTSDESKASITSALHQITSSI